MEKVVRRLTGRSQMMLCFSFYERLCRKQKVGRKLHESDKYNTVTETSLSKILVYVLYFVAVKKWVLDRQT